MSLDRVPPTDMFQVMNTTRSAPWAARLVCLAALLAASCASLEFDRDSATSGTFTSKGLALTVASIDIPKPAIDIARENASDAKLQNMQVNKVVVFPYLGWFDWLLDIVGVRYAKISGTWGYSGS